MSKTPSTSHMLTRERIESFPIAKSSMTERERRELCVSFFRFCQTWEWTPDRDLDFQRNKKGHITQLRKGKIYGGFPYGGLGSGNVYRMLRHFYDAESGVIKMDDLEKNPRIFCNQCSLGSGWAWRRVVTSANQSWTEVMTQKNGYLTVGPYTYDQDLSSFSKTTTKDICAANGEQIMYRSYAAMKPGDGLVMFTTAGHVIMCSSDPAVAYKKSGEINAEASYFTVIDQGQRFRTMRNSDGTEFTSQGGVDRPLFFNKALEGGYIPFTFAEFKEGAPIPKGEALMDLAEEEVKPDRVLSSVLTANHSITDVYVLLEKEKEAKTVAIPSMSCSVRAVGIGEHLSREDLNVFSGGKISIECQLANGEYLTAYSGKLK